MGEAHTIGQSVLFAQRACITNRVALHVKIDRVPLPLVIKRCIEREQEVEQMEKLAKEMVTEAKQKFDKKYSS